MASNNRGRNRSGRRSRNNNPEGYNQYSGLTARARENPLAAAAAVGGAVAAGVFLWSRRNQISDQIGNLSDQLSEWREGWQSGDEFGMGDDATTGGLIEGQPRRSSGNSNTGRKSQTQIAEEALTLKETGKATA
jgi:hypothetical protein